MCCNDPDAQKDSSETENRSSQGGISKLHAGKLYTRDELANIDEKYIPGGWDTIRIIVFTDLLESGGPLERWIVPDKKFDEVLRAILYMCELKSNPNPHLPGDIPLEPRDIRVEARLLKEGD